MVEVSLAKIIIDEKRQEQFILLKEKNGSRSLPIVIGTNEALAIRMKLRGVKPPRPLTHDLACLIIHKLKARLKKVVIDDLVEGVFHAKIYLAGPQKTPVVIDARPSDSIAIAVSTNSPIFTEERLFSGIS